MNIKRRKRILLALLPVLALVVSMCMPIGTVEAKAATKLSKCKIEVKDAALVNGRATPVVKVTYKNKTLKKGTDYKISLKNNKAYGTATITITGIKNYSGKVTKKFNVGPAKVENFKYEYITYEDGNSDGTFSWTLQDGANGYNIFLSETKNGKYIEVDRIVAEYGGFAGANYPTGSYAKIRSYVYKNGKYYYGAFTNPVKITGSGKDGTPVLRDYKVTASELTAPSGAKVVYDSPTSIYDDNLPKTLCLQFTNSASTTVTDWYIEYYDQDGRDIGSTNYGCETKAGETINLDMSSFVVPEPGTSIKKIRIIPMNGGTDGWTSSPWYNEMPDGNSDDTFGEAAVIDCNIKVNVVDKGTVKGSFGTTEWGAVGVNFKLKDNYDKVEYFVRSSHGGYGSGAGKNTDGNYIASDSDPEFKADIKDPNSFVTVRGFDFSKIKISGNNTATLTIDRYFLTAE